jgi:hypothetical protein
VVEQAVALVNSDDRVGIADVDRYQHRATIMNDLDINDPEVSRQ